jgi:glycerol-3-phosphate acyltransferase PlsY
MLGIHPGIPALLFLAAQKISRPSVHALFHQRLLKEAFAMFFSSPLIAAAAACAAGYLLGSVNFAVILSRMLAKEDVRKKGSGNAGTTNMLRSFGRLPAALTFLGDIAKGSAGALLGRALLAPFGLGAMGIYIGGLGTLVGHMKPIYFGFRGGKGVATGLGILLVIDWLVFLVLGATGIAISAVTGFVSLGSVVCAIALPFVLSAYRLLQHRFSVMELAYVSLFTLIVLWKHRGNIRRLLEGTERDFRKKKKDGGEPNG